MAELESQYLEPPDADGSEFLRSVRTRISLLNKHLKEESDRIRRARQLKNERETTVDVKVGDKVWLIDRNADHSRSIRKSGRGIPCRHRYEVGSDTL